MYAKLERFEEAMEDADEALRLDCEYAPAHLRKGVAALRNVHRLRSAPM